MSDNRVIQYHPPGPVSLNFLRSRAFISAIKGPVGSGKSTACVMKILRNAQMQPINSTGFRSSRYAIIRNTAPELKSTTMKTWHQWVPKSTGHWVGQGPPTHHIRDPISKLDMEVMFVALDSPDDVRKVLSMELTGAWVNEAREIPKAIIDGLTGRVGRYKPAVDEKIYAFEPQLIMDTNPPEDDHWWYVMAEQDTSTEFGRNILRSMEESEIELRNAGLLAPGQKLFEFFGQPGAYAPGAENIENLSPGYYARTKAGKDADWIKVYVDAEYGFVKTGKAVFPEYRDSLHCKEIELIPGLPIMVGLDFGLSPAAIFGQCTEYGQWRIYSELCGEGMNIFQFADAIKRHASQMYQGWKITKITGDPAGNSRSSTDPETRTSFQLLHTKKVYATPASTNDMTTRKAVVQQPLTRIVNGEPGMLIHKRCKLLRKGMAGGYCYKRVPVAGEDRYQDKPDKNRYSHPCFAAGTLITTPSGVTPIENLNAGDIVNTPLGPRIIRSAFNRPADTIALEFSNGTIITSTPDHPFFTQEGYARADALQYSHLIGTESRLWKFLFKSLHYDQGQSGRFTNFVVSVITFALDTTRSRRATTFTGRFGKQTMAPSQTDVMFTTKMETPQTTTRKICSVLPKMIMRPTTVASLSALQHPAEIFGKPLMRRLFGGATILKRPLSLESLPGELLQKFWPCSQKKLRNAHTAINHTKFSPFTKKEGSALHRASPPREGCLGWMMRLAHAVFAALGSMQTAIRRNAPVRLTARSACFPGHVYSIEVDDAHCYYANGLLVSNCDALQYLLLGGGEFTKIMDAGNDNVRPDILETYEHYVDGVM